jgi:protein gp37
MENSKIEWTQHTFSPWHGCAKVSPGCKNCYADAQHSFHYSSLKTQQGTCWGTHAPRLAVSEDTWKKPLRWNRAAQAAGVRARVFCASMADVFEPQSPLSASFAGQTAEVPKGDEKTRTVRFVDIATERLRLLRLIYDTPHLDWLLLTKRPEHIVQALSEAYVEATGDFLLWLDAWLLGTPPANVWLGTSVENQEQADARIPHLLAARALPELRAVA